MIFVIVTIALVLGTTLILRRASLVIVLKTWEASEFWIGAVETALAVIVTALVTAYKVWDLSNWTLDLYGSLIRLCWVATCVALAFFCKWLRERIKDRDKEKVERLERELVATKAHLNSLKRLGTQIRGLIERKIKRVRYVLKADKTTIHDLLIPTERTQQVHTILKSIHEFFHFDLKTHRSEGKMRLGLYLPDPQLTRFNPFFSWDGEHVDCVYKEGDYMSINSPKGVLSEIVRTYHQSGDHQLKLIPNCFEDPTFVWFRPQQKEYLKSMVSFKYLLEIDGQQAALILCLDCDEPNFFKDERKTEISQFLIEMLKRFEYEMLGLEIVNKMQLQEPHFPLQPKT